MMMSLIRCDDDIASWSDSTSMSLSPRWRRMAGLWLMKWSRDGGDLRVAHFFGIHAMQVLPMFAALLPRAWSARTAIVVVVGAAGVYAAATTFTFVQAIHGLPFA
jgi:hypothetical protein